MKHPRPLRPRDERIARAAARVNAAAARVSQAQEALIGAEGVSPGHASR